MAKHRDIPIDARTFQRVATSYRRRWGIATCAVAANGAIVLPAGRGKGREDAAAKQVRRLAIEEAMRWGEPTVQSGPGETLLWAVPLLHNSQLLGGLVASVSEQRLFAQGEASPGIDIRGACADLRRLAEMHNLTNAALLEIRRGEYAREQKRAEAIHSFKAEAHYDIRDLYLLHEPLLIAAIRKGDRGQARAILNQLLVGMIHRAGERLELVKSFFMELVAMMCRTAVESGGAPEELLGANFSSLVELAAIQSEERLAPWLHEVLERVLSSIQRSGSQTQAVVLSSALRFMAEHCCEDISRDRVAAVAHLSPSHFSRLFKKRLGQSFTAMLNQMRLDRACQLLARSDKSLKLIALESGFADQSYFTKVFRRHHGHTPAQYRREHEITTL